MSKACLKEGSDLFLPEELLRYAIKRGNDYFWRKRDLLHVAQLAEKGEIASGGWKALFSTPDGDCELCWYSFYPGMQGTDESWTQYVARSWEDSRGMWKKLFSDKKLIEEGRKAFRIFQETEVPGLLPRDVLCFILYFKTNPSVASGQQTDCQQVSAKMIPELSPEEICLAESRIGPRTSAPGKSF